MEWYGWALCGVVLVQWILLAVLHTAYTVNLTLYRAQVAAIKEWADLHMMGVWRTAEDERYVN